MTIKINEIEITDVEFLTDTECREIIGILGAKYLQISDRQITILDACELRVHEEYDYDDSDGWSDVEADADTLASAGWGTDEDYGSFDNDMEW